MFKKVILAIISFIVSIGIVLSRDVSVGNSIRENNFVILVLTVSMFFVSQMIDFKDKRKNIIITIASAILTLLQMLGTHVVTNNLQPMFYILKTFEYFFLFFIFIYFVFKFVDKIRDKEEKDDMTVKKKKINPVVIFFFLNLIIWFVFALQYYPGFVGFDVNHQMKQIFGVIPYNNLNPVFHTFIINICLKIGIGLFNNTNAGIFIFNLLQILLFDGVMTYFFYYIKRLGVNKYVQLVLMAFVTFNPVFPIYCLNTTKDVLFSIFFLLDIVLLLRAILEREKFFNVKNTIITFVAIFLTCLLRHNGIYVFLFMIPFMYIIIPKKKLKVTAFWLIMVLLINFYNGPIINAFGIGTVSNNKDLSSVPIQGIARVVKYAGDTISEEEIAEISNYLQYDRIASDYNEELSDRMKDILNLQNVNTNFGGLVKIYLKEFIAHPHICIEAFIRNTYSFWSTEGVRLKLGRDIYENDFNIHTTSVINSKVVNWLSWSCEGNSYPILSLLYNMGFTTWIIIICAFYLIYKKDYRVLMLFIPILLVFLTVLAGPLNGEFRYYYPIYICLVPLLSSIFLKKQFVE